MKNLIALIALIVLVASPLGAQGQEGSVALAATVRANDGGVTLQSFAACAADLVHRVGLKPEKATEECRRAGKEIDKASIRIANNAADATKASQPRIIVPFGFGGYGYRRYYRPYYRYGGFYATGARIERSTALAQARVERRVAEAEQKVEQGVAEAQINNERLIAETEALVANRAAQTRAQVTRSIGRSLAETTRAMAPSARRR